MSLLLHQRKGAVVVRRIRSVWQAVSGRGYPADVGVARNPAGRGGALRRPSALDGYEGRWVLLRGDSVIADAATDRQLVQALKRLDPSVRREAVMQYVPEPSKALMVGLG
jgi:hypothetical protein